MSFLNFIVLTFLCATSTNAQHGQFGFEETNSLPRKVYQECISVSGAKGYCTHTTHCALPDLKTNFGKYLAYLCVIENKSVGICCPELLSPRILDEKLPVWDNAISRDAQSNTKIINIPTNRGCGVLTRQLPKVNGGRPADPREWPWIAGLMLGDAQRPLGGGVLISDKHILTAAHCVHQTQVNDLRIRLGEYDFKRPSETRNRDFLAVEIREHADFDPTTYENDIALVKLHRSVRFDSYIWPICLPPSGNTYEGRVATVAGWGTQSFGGPTSPILMEVTIPIWRMEDCRNAFVYHIPNEWICAGGTKMGQDSCQGDSGGPLIIETGDSTWSVIGIVSWGVGCGNAKRPGLYTRVSSYLPWITQNILY